MKHTLARSRSGGCLLPLGHGVQPCASKRKWVVLNIELSVLHLSGYWIFYVYDGGINLSSEMESVISKGNKITHAH